VARARRCFAARPEHLGASPDRSAQSRPPQWESATLVSVQVLTFGFFRKLREMAQPQPHQNAPKCLDLVGAGEGNRTLVSSRGELSCGTGSAVCLPAVA